MPLVDVVMPKMGESITDATIIKWFKKKGDIVEEEETLLEVATDKVDSEIPSPVKGVVVDIVHQEDEVVEIGEIIARIETTKGDKKTKSKRKNKDVEQVANVKEAQRLKSNEELENKEVINIASTSHKFKPKAKIDKTSELESFPIQGTNFYSPLVKSIAAREGIGLEELDTISGTGANGRVSKSDLLSYIRKKEHDFVGKSTLDEPHNNDKSFATNSARPRIGLKDEIVEMDRIRKIIADHMITSKRVSAHVTSFAEADVTTIVKWRNSNKNSFESKHGQKLTFTPIFVEAISKALQNFPGINISVEGDKIIYKKDINIGIATALPSGNLIVPVIHNADLYNLQGLATQLNDKVDKARNNKLDPSEIQDGTFTLTNIGTYGNILGTPIINQPQVAILAIGAIKKKPVVIESNYGDSIGVRHMMYLSLSFDHRVVDGFMGGTFLETIVKYLENFDATRKI